MSLFQRNPIHAHHSSGNQTPLSPAQQGWDEGHAKWPPQVARVEVLGYMQSPTQPFYSHDIGRSFLLDGRIYKFNGDTFCNNAGLSSNTYQLIPNHKKPTEAYFVETELNGYVQPLIKNDPEEELYLSLPQNQFKRIAFWCFGGVIEFSPGLGWVWYQKFIVGVDTGIYELCGVGIARISHDKNRLSGELSSARMPGLMFEPGEPLFGSFSTLLVDDMAYLWGQKDTDVFLARVPKSCCQHRHLYQYWNGKDYTSNISQSAPVLQDYQQGQFFRSDMFGPRFGCVFVGCTKWADNQVMMGVASRLEGPWDVVPIVHTIGIKDNITYRYCMYPHPWANEVSKAKLLVSWCDRWPGGVIAAKVRFATEGIAYWTHITLCGCSDRVIHTALEKAKELCNWGPFSCEELIDPHRLRIRGLDQRAVDTAVNMIRHTIAIVKKEEMAEMEVAAVRARRPSLAERIVAPVARLIGHSRCSSSS
ncbi:MAG: hypothetical protein Q9166_003173 [cf. Caloplaca sp. 2 TL-2023]